jgi:hypothetical protein
MKTTHLKKLAVFFATAFALAGCATPYQSKGAMGGYSELKLNSDTFQIDVAGNGYTSSERARNIAMLRACELVTAAGFDRFVIVSGGVQQEYAGSTPVVANRVGNTVIASGGDAITKPNGNLIVRGVRPSDPAYAGALDAKLIDAQLRPTLVASH